MIDVLFVAKNRLAMTQASFTMLLANTDWQEVAGLFIADDASTDGTAEWLRQVDLTAHIGPDVQARFNPGPFRGPVAAMNWYLDHASPDADRFAKIDNDFIVCPGWLPDVLRQMTINPDIDIFGIQPRFGPPTLAGDLTRTVEPCRHIGGIGVIRNRVFELCRPVANGRFGWTEYQTQHAQTLKAWLTPDLPCFSLDLIDLEPWRTLTTEYVEKGWARRWPMYEGGGHGYYDWWAT